MTPRGIGDLGRMTPLRSLGNLGRMSSLGKLGQMRPVRSFGNLGLSLGRAHGFRQCGVVTGLQRPGKNLRRREMRIMVAMVQEDILAAYGGPVGPVVDPNWVRDANDEVFVPAPLVATLD